MKKIIEFFSGIFNFRKTKSIEDDIKEKFNKISNDTEYSSFEEMYQKIGILYIKPINKSEKPVMDEITEKFTKLWERAIPSDLYWFGCHTCVCGTESEDNDFILWTKNVIYLTNSLCVHYITNHRSEIPEAEWDKIIRITSDMDE